MALRKLLSVTLSMGTLLAGLTLLAAACSEDPPPPPPPPPPQRVYTEWVHLPVRMEFPTSDENLDQQQRALLREVVNTLRSRPDVRRLRIEGHADGRGSAEENYRLSLGRAQSVLEELVRLGVDRGMLEAVGYGDTQPITSETTSVDLTRNRRVEFSVLVETPVQ